MPIVADIRDELLQMAGLETVTDGPPNLEYRIISDINRAIDKIGDMNPSVYFQTRPDQAEAIRAPVQLTVQVTNLSKEITIASGYVASWMAGCAILISGDSTTNRLANEETGDNPTLEQPYMGETGTVTATVWHDWIKLPANVNTFMDPVTINKNWMLTRAQDLNQLDRRWIGRGWVNGDYYSGDYGLVNGWQKAVDRPQQWYEVARYVQAELISGIMLDALPPSQYKLCYTAKVGINRVISLADNRQFITPESKDQEILLPICRWYFSSYQMCSTPKTELQADYQDALLAASALGLAGNRRNRIRYCASR